MQTPYSPDPSPLKSALPAIAVPAQPMMEPEEELSLGDLMALIRRRWWIILLVFLTVGGGVLKWRLDRPPVYQADFQLQATPPVDVSTNPLLNLQGLSALTNSRVFGENYFATQANLMASKGLLEPVWQTIYEEEQAQGILWMDYRTFTQNLKIELLPDSSIFQITFQDIDRERTKRVLDSLAAAYLDFTEQEQTRVESEKLGLVNQQLPKFRERVNSLQQQLLGLQQKHQFFDPAATGQQLSAQVEAIASKRKEVAVTVDKLKAKKQFLERETGVTDKTQAFNVSSLSQSPTYTALLTQLNQVNTELAKASAVFTDGTPQIQTLKEQRENVLQLIQQEVKRQPAPVGNATSLLKSAEIAGPRAVALQELATTGVELEALTLELNKLTETEAELRQQLQTFTSVAGQYTSLTQELDIQKAGLNQFLEAKQSLEIEVSKSFTPWRLISAIKLPDEPLSTLPRDILLSLMAGLVAGGALALLVDKLDPTYHTLEQIQADLKQTILGNIPFEPKLRSAIKTGRSLKSVSLSEAYAKLYSNLFFLGRKQVCRAFVITSAESRDGKSTTAFFLAQAAAKLGKRVLLIDGDRYYPQEKNWKTLAAITQGSTQTETAPNAEVSAPQGVVQPEALGGRLFYYKVQDDAMNPEQLVSSSENFVTLLSQWKEQFDLILIDTPPLLGLTDSRLIADQTDGVVLVVRLEKTRRESIQGAYEELKLADLNILGIVANAVSSRSGGYGYYYHYYNRYYRKYLTKIGEQAKQARNNGAPLS